MGFVKTFTIDFMMSALVCQHQNMTKLLYKLKTDTLFQFFERSHDYKSDFMFSLEWEHPILNFNPKKMGS